MSDPALDNALRLRHAGRLAEAADIYRQMLIADPRHFEALHALGILRYQSGQIDEAERLIGAAIAVQPRAADAIYNRACLLQKLGRMDDAISGFGEAIAIRPDYVEALTNRGSALMQLARYAEAKADFDAVVSPELVTSSLAEYETRARELARDPSAFAVLKARLAANRTTHPLFDTALFTRNLEAAYTRMWQNHRAGLPPEGFG